ncbi:MAG: flavin reductase family protein [Lachnospiraceae bacterium]|nr:flavin reductase family protein [Lachnospiraceae bacterium]
MSKRQMKPGNMLYPVPAALVSVRDKEGNSNFITIAWCGTVCSTPPMLSVSVQKIRHSHKMLLESGEFVLNLTTEDMVRATDLAGVISGRDGDKWEKTGLHEEPANVVGAPMILESPVNIECRVREVLELGSHDMFLAEVVSVSADESFFDEKGRFDMEKCGLIVYEHGSYRALGKTLGTYGFSVRKKKKT